MWNMKALSILVQKLWEKTDRRTVEWDLMSPRFRESGRETKMANFGPIQFGIIAYVFI